MLPGRWILANVEGKITMTYFLLGLLILLIIFLGNSLNNQWIERSAKELGEDIERYIEAEVETRLKGAGLAENDKDRH